MTLALLFASGCGSCQQEEAAPAPDTGPEAASDPDASSDTAEADALPREAFGLPMPPDVIGVNKIQNMYRVETHLTLEELENFFRSRLVDYEYLKPKEQLRIIGLREYMPYIHAWTWGPRSNLRVLEYYPAPPKPVTQPIRARNGGDDSTTAEETDDTSVRGARAGIGPKPLESRQKGEPVLDRTAEGEPLAPGARWGEPYTPPPGTPLHKKRYESNWGRPFGEWRLQ